MINIMRKTNNLFISRAFLLIGDGFWMKNPQKEYLKILGDTESGLMYHNENIEKPEKLGLTYWYSNIASVDHWDRFEGVYF